MSCAEVVNYYFNSYDVTEARADLEREASPTPIYRAPLGVAIVPLALDAIWIGTPLAIVYSIAAFCLKKCVSSASRLPSLSSRTLLMALTIFAYRTTQLIVGYVIHPAALPFFPKTPECYLFSL